MIGEDDADRELAALRARRQELISERDRLREQVARLEAEVGD